MSTARAKKIAKHERYAADAFKRHVIRQDLDQGLFRSWRCGAPDDGNHHFHVITAPGRIFVAGDNGTMVWERCENMIPWCRGAINSIDYFAEKVPSEIPTRQFDRDVARDWVNLQIIEDSDHENDAKYRQLLDVLDNEELHDHEFSKELHESGLVDGCDWPDFRNWTSNFLWCREDLKWFLANLPEITA